MAGPVCYRHPDRVTYIACSRCDRPICPDCMNPAAVGFQCPDCVAAGRAAVRAPTGPMGGAVALRPRVTVALIGLNVGVFAVGLLLGSSRELIGRFGMWPLAIAGQGEWGRLLTSAFLHGGLLHIGFNMYVLYMVGPVLERILGSGRFLVLYLMSAAGGSVASYVFNTPNTLSVGASGAIFGLLGALLVVGKRLRHDVSQVAVLLGINVLIGFVVPGIDWRAHFGGAIAGAVIAAVLAYAPRSGRTLWQVLGVLGVLLALVLATLWRTAELQRALASLLGLG